MSEFVDGETWSAFGRALAHRRQRTMSFSFARTAAPAPWKRVHVRGRRAVASSDVDRVLAWLAFTGVFDAGHLRWVCRRLGFGPEVEIATWTDARVVRGHTGFAWIAETAVERARKAFLALDDQIRTEAIALQAAWRAHHSEEVVALEYLTLRAREMQVMLPETVRRRAEAFWKRLAATERRLPPHHPDKGAVHDWIRRTDAQVGRDAFSGADDVGHALQQLWWAACRERRRNGVARRAWTCESPLRTTRPQSREPMRFGRTAHRYGVGWLRKRHRARPRRAHGSELSLRKRLSVVSTHSCRAGPWMEASTRTGGGPAFEVAGVSQVMRWIPPGTFMMGSPESEEDRYRRRRPSALRHIERRLLVG